ALLSCSICSLGVSPPPPPRLFSDLPLILETSDFTQSHKEIKSDGGIMKLPALCFLIFVCLCPFPVCLSLCLSVRLIQPLELFSFSFHYIFTCLCVFLCVCV